ncbi:MAG: GFA family protein [Pseudomonadota bacterium]
MADDLTGGCSCGAVRYRLTQPPIFVHCCHCTWCQRETGSAFVINILIEADAVETVKGAPIPISTPTASGKPQSISRCPDCHVALWSTYGGSGPAIRFVRAGTLDNPSSAPPDIHIFTASKVSWVDLPEGATAVLEFYDYETTWPAESFARRAAARAGNASRETR